MSTPPRLEDLWSSLISCFNVFVWSSYNCSVRSFSVTTSLSTLNSSCSVLNFCSTAVNFKMEIEYRIVGTVRVQFHLHLQLLIASPEFRPSCAIVPVPIVHYKG